MDPKESRQTPLAGPALFAWRKSTRSGPYSDNCVEVGFAPDSSYVGVRDTKDPDGGTQLYTKAEWLAFIEGVKAGEFDVA